MGIINWLLEEFSMVTVFLNRVLAWVDFFVHHISGYCLYFLGGLKPVYHTRPNHVKGRNGHSPFVVVTGASEGIGLATSSYLAQTGYTVFATVKNETELLKFRTGISERGPNLPEMHQRIRPLIMDVLSPSSISTAVEYIGQQTQDYRPHVPLCLVNNAGYCMISPMELTPDESVRSIFELDFFAYISVIRAFLPMIKQTKGRIVNVGSYGAFVNPPMWAPYSALKAAIEGLTRAWRMELIPFGVGMTSVRPGWTRTTGIGPKIKSGWNEYLDNIDKGSVGVDSLGQVVYSNQLAGPAEKRVYGSMMSKWYNLTMTAAAGAAEPAEAVAMTIHDALTDVFLQPNYTVGYDALLGQMVRDLVPENVYEYSLMKTFL